MSKNKTKQNLEIIRRIPSTNKYWSTKIKKHNNWFNKNVALFILISFVLIGITIVFLIAK